MQSITVVEYLNYVNERGEDIGHGKKVLREAVELLGDDLEVHCIASRAYCPEGCKLDCELPALNQSAGEATGLLRTIASSELCGLRRLLLHLERLAGRG